MKEHRDPPPFAAGEPRIRPAALSAQEPLALPPPRSRRISGRVLVRSWPIFLLIGLVAAYLAYLGARAAHSWLAQQPAYQLPFRAIRLDPPPPSWYRGGVEAFLEDVRRRARMPETLPLLGLKEDDVGRAFENSPWTREVRGIEYIPLGLTVRLVYRRPVAMVETDGPKPIMRYPVDEAAVILPREDLLCATGPSDGTCGLIPIRGKNLLGPSDPTPGLVWKPKPGAVDLHPGNGRIPAAASLAGFLADRIGSIDLKQMPALDFRWINPMDDDGGTRCLWLWNAGETIVRWGEPPGEEAEGEPAAEEKWGRLVEWARMAPTPAASKDTYWQFTSRGMKVVPVPHRLVPESARNPAPRRDGATLPAKASGHRGKSLSH